MVTAFFLFLAEIEIFAANIISTVRMFDKKNSFLKGQMQNDNQGIFISEGRK